MTQRPWKALIIAPGDRELVTMRGVTEDSLRDLGFEPRMWDTHYEVNPTVGTDGACLDAIRNTDIVIALVSLSPGSPIRADDPRFVPPVAATQLRSLSVLPDPSSQEMPTVFQTEVLAARALKKPTIVFAEDEGAAALRRATQALRENPALLRSIHGSVDPSPLIERAEWRLLWTDFDGGVVDDVPVKHVVFYQRIRTEPPGDWLEPLNLSDMAGLTSRLRNRVAQIPIALVHPEDAPRANTIEQRLSTARAPLTSESLRSLQQANRIIPSPYEVDGGASTEDLIHLLEQTMRRGESAVILGEPGLGKTTSSLLLADSLSQSEEQTNVLFGRWKEIEASDPGLPETLLGNMWSRDPWLMELPAADWIVVVDGLDEATLSSEDMRLRVTETLERSGFTLLTTCRASEWDRHFNDLNSVFHHIIVLLPWDEVRIREYASALRASGRSRPADYIEAHISDQLEFLSYPLWLAMIAYLAERTPSSLEDLTNDVAVLEACGDAVARDEVRRHGLADSEVDWLRRTWAQAAWLLHSERAPIDRAHVFERLNLPDDEAYQGAVDAIFEPFSGDRIAGFFHEVFLEFWLAAFIADTVLESDAQEIVTALSLHRSRLTNRLIRGRLRSTERVGDARDALQAAYWQAAPAEEYTKNQLLYLLGRIDNSDPTQRFLSSVWSNPSEPLFVRYSAGFAAVIAGDMQVEESFFSALREDQDLDAINRGYHRAYHGDIMDVDERDMPVHDDGVGSMAQAIRSLCRRLQSTHPRRLRLRRIELYTLRRLVETRTGLVGEASEVIRALDAALETTTASSLAPSFKDSVAEEVERLRQFISG